MFTEEQEMAFVNIVLSNNAIWLREVGDRILNDATLLPVLVAIKYLQIQRYRVLDFTLFTDLQIQSQNIGLYHIY